MSAPPVRDHARHELLDAGARHQRARALFRDTLAARDDAIRAAVAGGMSRREAGRLLGISHAAVANVCAAADHQED